MERTRVAQVQLPNGEGKPTCTVFALGPGGSSVVKIFKLVRLLDEKTKEADAVLAARPRIKDRDGRIRSLADEARLRAYALQSVEQIVEHLSSLERYESVQKPQHAGFDRDWDSVRTLIKRGIKRLEAESRAIAIPGRATEADHLRAERRTT